MESHLRSAERQGLLTGLHLSLVQAEGLDILTYLDQVRKWRQENDAFAYALLSRPEYDPKKMFPDHFTKSVTTTDELPEDDENVEYDYSHVEWKGPSDVDQEELKRILAIVENAQGKVDMEQAESRQGRDWV
jgi:hypothetical protein